MNDGSPPTFDRESFYVWQGPVVYPVSPGQIIREFISFTGNTIAGQTFVIDPQSLYPGGAATYYGTVGGIYLGGSTLEGAATTCFNANSDGKQASSNRSLNICNWYETSTRPTVTDIAVDTSASGSCAELLTSGSGWSPVSIANWPCNTGHKKSGSMYNIAYTNEFYVIENTSDHSTVEGTGYVGCQPSSVTYIDKCSGAGSVMFCATPDGIANCPFCQNYTTLEPSNKEQLFNNQNRVLANSNNDNVVPYTTSYVSELESSVCFAKSCQASYALCVQAQPGVFPVQFSFAEFNYDNCDATVCTPPTNGPYYCTENGGSARYQRVLSSSNVEYNFFEGCNSSTGPDSSTSYSVGDAYMCRDNPTVYVPANSQPAPYQALQANTSCLDTTQVAFYVVGAATNPSNGLWPSSTQYNSLACVRVVNNYQIPPSTLPYENNYGNAISNRTTYPVTFLNTPNGSFVLAANSSVVNAISNMSDTSGVSSVSPVWLAESQAFICQNTQTITMLSEQYDTLLFVGVEDGAVGNLPPTTPNSNLYVFAVQYNVPTLIPTKQLSTFQFSVLGTQTTTLSTVNPDRNYLFIVPNFAALQTDSFRLVGLANFNAQYYTTTSAAESFAVLVLDITDPSQSQYYENNSKSVVPLNSDGSGSSPNINVTDSSGQTTTGASAFSNIFPANCSIVYVKSTYSSPQIDIFYYPNARPDANAFNPTVLRLEIVPVLNSNSQITSINIAVLSTPSYNLQLSDTMSAAYPETDYLNFTFASGVDYSNVYWFGMSTLFETEECGKFCSNGDSTTQTQCYTVLQEQQCGQGVQLDSMNCRAACFGTGVVVGSGAGQTIASSGLYNCDTDMLNYCQEPNNVSTMCSCFAGSQTNLNQFLSNATVSTLAKYDSVGLDSRYVNELRTMLEAIAENPYCSNPSCSSKAQFPNTTYGSCDQAFEIQCLQCVKITENSQGNYSVVWDCGEQTSLTSTCKVYNQFCYVYENAFASCGGNEPKPHCNNCAPPATPWYLNTTYLIAIGVGLFVIAVALVFVFVPKKRSAKEIAKRRSEAQSKALQALQQNLQQRQQTSVKKGSIGVLQSKSQASTPLQRTTSRTNSNK